MITSNSWENSRHADSEKTLRRILDWEYSLRLQENAPAAFIVFSQKRLFDLARLDFHHFSFRVCDLQMLLRPSNLQPDVVWIWEAHDAFAADVHEMLRNVHHAETRSIAAQVGVFEHHVAIRPEARVRADVVEHDHGLTRLFNNVIQLVFVFIVHEKLIGVLSASQSHYSSAAKTPYHLPSNSPAHAIPKIFQPLPV